MNTVDSKRKRNGLRKVTLSKILKWYNKNSSFYSKKIIHLKNFNQITDFLSLVPKKKIILDADCAVGRDSNFFLKRSFNIIGIVLSKNLIEIEKNWYKKNNFILAKIRKIPFLDNYSDTILARHFSINFETVEDIRRLKTIPLFYRALNENKITHKKSSLK